MDNFFKTYTDTFCAIELCVENRLILPALTILYASIDSLAWIAYGDIASKKRFIKWVDEYMCSNKKLEAEAIDLYSARCAILHTLTPHSDLSNNKKAKVVAYAWGNASANTGNKVTNIAENEQQTVFVHINDLFNALKLGALKFINSATFDNECKERAENLFGHLSRGALDELVALHGN